MCFKYTLTQNSYDNLMTRYSPLHIAKEFNIRQNELIKIRNKEIIFKQKDVSRLKKIFKELLQFEIVVEKTVKPKNSGSSVKDFEKRKYSKYKITDKEDIEYFFEIDKFRFADCYERKMFRSTGVVKDETLKKMKRLRYWINAIPYEERLISITEQEIEAIRKYGITKLYRKINYEKVTLSGLVYRIIKSKKVSYTEFKFLKENNII